MSIRFYLSHNSDELTEQIRWCKDNVPSNQHSISTNARYVDFLDDEDAMMFTIRFGIRKHSTLIERMIYREEMYERMEEHKLRDSKHGMGPWCAK